MFSRKRISDLVVEGVVIVASILLAFALDAWWQERGERAEEQEILENLRLEFREAGVQLDRYLTFHHVTLASTRSVLDALREGQAADRPTVEVPTIDLSRILIGPTFDPRMGTLDGLLHSGRGSILRNDDLQISLAAWPGLLAEAKEEEVKTEGLILDQMGPSLRTQMDISRAHLLTEEVIRERCANLVVGRSCEDIRKEAELPEQWVTTTIMPVNFEVLGLFAARNEILAHLVDQFMEVREEIDLILGQLEEDLEV